MLNWFRRASRCPCLRHDTPEGFHTLLSNAPDADSPPGCAIAERTALPHVLSQKDAGVDSSGTAVIPEGTEEIACRAFAGMEHLRRVALPGSVRKLGSRAFAGCRSLTEAALNGGLELLEENAFAGCTALRAITIPASVRAVHRHAFLKCTALEPVDILCDLAVIAQGTFALCPRLRLLHRGVPVSFTEELRLRGIHVLDARGGAAAPAGTPWEAADFQALAARCAQGDGAAMWAFAEYLEALAQVEFFFRAANFWRYQAARRGDERAASWIQRWFAEHPRQRIPSVLCEDLSPGATGRALRAMGFSFFDLERTYTLDGLDDNGIIRARAWCGGEGPDEDGYGREELYDWWLLDGLLRPIPGVPMLRACSAREIRSSEQYAAAYAAAVRTVRHIP